MMRRAVSLSPSSANAAAVIAASIFLSSLLMDDLFVPRRVGGCHLLARWRSGLEPAEFAWDFMDEERPALSPLRPAPPPSQLTAVKRHR